MTSYAIVYFYEGQWHAHSITEDRQRALREYERLRREAPDARLEIRQVPTGLAVSIDPLLALREGP